VYFVATIPKAANSDGGDSDGGTHSSPPQSQDDPVPSSRNDRADPAKRFDKLDKFGVSITYDLLAALPEALAETWQSCLERFRLLAPVCPSRPTGGGDIAAAAVCEEYDVEALKRLLDPEGMPVLRPIPPPPKRSVGTRAPAAVVRKYSHAATSS
jgi:hypothetical protein